MSRDELIAAMNSDCSSQVGLNAWTMPINTRVDMLTTGVRTPAGIKVFGQDLRRSKRWANGSRRCCPACPALPEFEPRILGD